MSNRTSAGAANRQSPNTPRGTAVMVAVVVLICIGAVIALSLRGGATDDETQPGPVTCEKPPAPPSQAEQFSKAPAASTAEGSTWRATVQTNCGDITLELFGDKAPQTVASFIHLAGEDYWADSPCHRLTTQGIFALQCGDPTGTGTGDPGYGFGIENAPSDGSYPRGTLAMARSSDPNSNGGQFFIVYDDTKLPVEGGGYSIFGRVTAGMDIVDAVAKKGVQHGAPDGRPAQPISILGVSVETE